MGERLLCKQEVAGSIPAGSIRKSLQEYRFRGLGRGAGRVVFLHCVPCVPHVREARAVRVGPPSDAPNAWMGYAKLTATERYLHSEPTAYRHTSRGPTGSSRRRVRARVAPWRTHQPVRREKGRRPPDASASRSATARGLSVASRGTRELRRRYWLSAFAGVRRGPIARCRTPGRRPDQARDGQRAGRSHCVPERKRRPSRWGIGLRGLGT